MLPPCIVLTPSHECFTAQHSAVTPQSCVRFLQSIGGSYATMYWSTSRSTVSYPSHTRIEPAFHLYRDRLRSRNVLNPASKNCFWWFARPITASQGAVLASEGDAAVVQACTGWRQCCEALGNEGGSCGKARYEHVG